MVMYDGVWGDKPVYIGDALLISVIAILIVFLTLVIVIALTTFIQKGMNAVDGKLNIKPRKENEILAKDNDAVVAVLAATIDFHRETKKEPRVISVTQIEE